MSRLLRVAGWWGFAAFAAAACLWSAADRLAAQGVVLGAAPMLLTGGNALTARAWLADREGRRADAMALAQQAVRRRPVDAVTLRTAGFAALATGDAARADALLRLAGTAGWRDVPTQLYWAQSARRAGAWDVAAERLDAVMRTTADPRAAMLLRHIEAVPAGRAALARRIAVPNRWAARWLADIDGLDARAIEARFATASVVRDSLERSALEDLGEALVGRGRADLAWRLLRPRGGRLPDLATASDRAGPFDWALSAAAGLDARVEMHGQQRALHVEASGPALLPVAAVMLRLPPGLTRMTVAEVGAKTTLPLVATLECGPGGTGGAEPLDAVAGRVAFFLTVSPGCDTQRLTLAVAGEEARRGADLWLGEVTLSRAAAAP